jgi:hypothetical protein
VSGAALWLLKGEFKSRDLSEPASDSLSLVADDEGGSGRPHGGRRPQDVGNHGASSDRMQDLREVGFHTRPLSSRQDDDVSLSSGHLTDFFDRSMMA